MTKVDENFEVDPGTIKKIGRRKAGSWGRTAKPDGKRRANKGSRRKKPTHKQW